MGSPCVVVFIALDADGHLVGCRFLPAVPLRRVGAEAPHVHVRVLLVITTPRYSGLALL
ncbi:hypothetical protein [Pseudomonas sp.]|uniref:hypothetical protein n=1 Tax=Pseudomonas sp. TaxID=306 RepID=UPI00299D04BC|nr:hypothetical protein [Pseudomonas sp.]MDX1369740.1 hypothetical protein [Pseudomonas sp.]